MDFFLSKFINRSSPSNGTELTNEESYCNQIEDETFKNSNNHSSEGRDQGLQVNQNLPDINFITNNASTCEEQINYNSNGSKIVLDESSKLNLNGINAEHKAMEILLSGSPKEESGVYPLSAASLFSEEIIPSTSNDSQVNKTVITQTNILPNSNIKIHQKSTDKTDNIKKNSEIEIEMTENRTKISKKSIQSNPKEFSAMQETLIQGPNIDNIAKIDPDFTNNTVENQLYNFNQKKMGIQDPPDIENFNEILELLAQEDLLDEFSIATAIQYLKNSNQESELCEINSDLVIKDETELNQSSIVNNNDNPFIQENCSNIINLTNYVAESKTADKIFATKIDENKDQSVSNKTDSLNDEILNITNNKVEVPLEILHEKCDTTVAKKEQYEILGTKFSKYDINSFTDINSNKSLLLNENLNPNTISTVNTELLKEQQEQKSSASTNILNSKKIAPLDDIKIKENVKQPASVAATASDTVNVKPVENSAIANKQTQFQSNKNISKVKESEENIDPIETRRFGDVSSLFSTPDSVSPNGTFSEATLPDIINTLPTITIDTQGNDILNISSLTSHLDALHVHNSEKSPNTLNATITKSNVSPSNISSDDELFAECESFPASANNSTTDFNATNKIETEQPINLDTNLKLNMQFVENCKSDSSTFSEVNIVQNVSQNDIEIDLNQNLKEEPNCSITSKAQDAISQRPEIDTINNNQDLNAKNLNKGSEVKTDYDAEKGSVFEILDEKTPEDSLEYIPTEQNIKQKQSSNSSIDIDSMSDSLNDTNRKTSESANFNHQLNISAQWSDIVSSINSIEQENLENSQLDLLNTTPQVIVQAASTAPIVDKKSSKYNTPNLVEEETLLYKKQDKICIFEHTNENIEKQTNAQNEQFKLNVIEVPLSKDDTSEKETTMNITSEIKSAFQSLNIAGQENNLSNSLDCRNCLNDVENLNIIQSVSESVQPSYSNDATIAVCSEKTDKTHDIVIENDSKLSPDRSFSSNSRDSLNDIEIMNITQNVSANIQPSYSNDVTIEVCDEAMNKTHNVAIKNNSQLLLDRTQESPKLTNITKERALNEMRNEPDINKEIVKKLDNASPSALENNFNNYFCKVQDEKFDCVTSTLNLGKANNDLKFNSVQVSNLNLPDGCNLTDKNDNSEHIVNAKRNLSNIPNCNNDFEYMDVDISFENENQEIFTKINDNIEKTETAPFSILPQNFEICKNMDEFKSIGNDNNVDLIFQSCDFEYLSKRGNNTVRDTRKDSILLKFDPLLGKPVPASTNLFNRSTIHEEEDTISPETSIGNRIRNREKEFQIESNNILINVPTTNVESQSKKQKSPIKLSINKKDITRSSNTFDSPLLEEFENLERRLELEEREAVVNKMSVDVISNNLKIENDVQPNENINSEINSIEKQDLKMEDLEKKIKNEVLKTEDVEKKLKDAEQREEALLKRITDKDKTIAKMGGVIEAYEKAIAELIAEKEQITQNYEKQMEEIKAERDLNKQHLESLESTFTDLHVKYERSKQLLAKLKASEEELQAEKKRNLENLGLQEQRYEKMKNHAMQQLEIANNKLEHLTKNHQLEITKLKALLKKEEIAKSSVNEQLIQKSKENEELVKICEELINGGSAS